MAASSSGGQLISAEKVLVFDGNDENWDTYSSLVQSSASGLVFILHFATQNAETTRRAALEMYKEWCKETNETEFNTIETTFKEEMIKVYGKKEVPPDVQNPAFEFADEAGRSS